MFVGPLLNHRIDEFKSNHITPPGGAALSPGDGCSRTYWAASLTDCSLPNSVQEGHARVRPTPACGGFLIDRPVCLASRRSTISAGERNGAGIRCGPFTEDRKRCRNGAAEGPLFETATGPARAWPVFHLGFRLDRNGNLKAPVTCIVPLATRRLARNRDGNLSLPVN